MSRFFVLLCNQCLLKERKDQNIIWRKRRVEMACIEQLCHLQEQQDLTAHLNHYLHVNTFIRGVEHLSRC